MTGWQKVAALAGLYVVAMLYANYAMLRRVRGAVAERAAWTVEDFDAIFANVDPRVAPVVRSVLVPWYGPGVVPRPEDTLRRFLKMDRGDVDDTLAAAEDALQLPHAVATPDLPDVAALTRYLAARLEEAGGAGA
ncbi:hypothetical protein [Sphingomonas sp.]|uniref:hypothetical protein n=1 Tax=Sphingomonas sp. TaxID=28214 RepID=UPI0035C81EB2